MLLRIGLLLAALLAAACQLVAPYEQAPMPDTARQDQAVDGDAIRGDGLGPTIDGPLTSDGVKPFDDLPQSTLDTGPACQCSFGQQRACGSCNEGSQTCSDGCHWDPCENQGCVSGASQPCGNCGRRDCVDCAWTACLGEGTCSPGDSRPCQKCGTQTCTAACTWGACKDQKQCEPAQVQSCGDCGKQICTATCAWGPCGGEGCTPGSKQGCPNGCGEKTCGADCKWGSCSKAGLLVKPGPSCWSNNHCQPGGKCVACWQRCDADGNLHNDGWCGTCTSCAGKIDQC